MKVIDNLVAVDLKNNKNETLIINSLYGFFDVLTYEEFNIVNTWMKKRMISEDDCGNEMELQLFNSLRMHGYIMEPDEEKNVKERLIDFLIKEDKEIRENPTCIYFIFSYRCNFSCSYCYENKRTQDIYIPTFTQEMVDAVLANNPQAKNICLFGGEPLLSENKQIIEYLFEKAKDCSFSVITNGYNLDEYIEDLLKVKIQFIQITLDGNKELHDRFRFLKNGEGTYEKIIKNIDLCLRNNIPVKVRINISKQNRGAAFDLRNELIKKFHSSLLSFEMQSLFQSSDAERNDVLFSFYRNEQKEHISQNYRNKIFKTFPPVTNFLVNKIAYRPIIRFCNVEQQSRFFDNYGDIYSCILSVGDKRKSIGSFFPKLIYKDNSMFMRTALNFEKCKNCRYLFICGGGCPNAIDGDFNQPNCRNLINEINNYIPFFYKNYIDKQNGEC